MIWIYSLKRIHQNGLENKTDNGSFESDNLQLPVPVNLPRKSSLKPPRVESFPILSVPNPDILNFSEQSSVRRKSMVTFNERTEIRS